MSFQCMSLYLAQINLTASLDCFWDSFLGINTWKKWLHSFPGNKAIPGEFIASLVMRPFLGIGTKLTASLRRRPSWAATLNVLRKVHCYPWHHESNHGHQQVCRKIHAVESVIGLKFICCESEQNKTKIYL